MFTFNIITASRHSISYYLCQQHLKRIATTFQSTLKTQFYKGPCNSAVRIHYLTVTPKRCSSKIKLVYFLIASMYTHGIALKLTLEMTI